MEPISTLAATAANYVLKGALQSKVAGNAKEEILSKFWQWTKRLFIGQEEIIEVGQHDKNLKKSVEKTIQRTLEENDIFHEQLSAKVDEINRYYNNHNVNIVNGNVINNSSGDIVMGNKNIYHNE